mmetsp:Transcript_7882/g.9666  ORF Transcript_7882/g.9666 Transcript_7882/m.9666 type:complete len:132 (-) Transcript_7882:34-429(-)
MAVGDVIVGLLLLPAGGIVFCGRAAAATVVIDDDAVVIGGIDAAATKEEKEEGNVRFIAVRIMILFGTERDGAFRIVVYTFIVCRLLVASDVVTATGALVTCSTFVTERGLRLWIDACRSQVYKESPSSSI